MIANLQVLRAVAAYMVFLHHFSAHLRPVAGGWRPIEIGAAGVDIFFVISGFIMVATTMGREVGPADFLRKRVARLCPVYWLVTLAVVLLVLAGFRPIGVFEAHPGDVIRSLLFIPFLRQTFVEPIVSVGWTLNYEMFFYVVFAALLVVRSEALRLAALVAVLVGLGLANLLEPAGFYAQFYTRPIVIDFALGAILGYAHHRTRHRAVGPGGRILGYGSIAAGLALLAAGEAAARYGAFDIELMPFTRLLTWGTASLMIVAGALLVERAGEAWNAPVLIAQGDASYSIYLIHNLVLHAASKVAGAIAPGTWIGAGLTFALALGTTAVLGAWLYRRFEMPLNRALRAALRAPVPRAGMADLAVRR